MKLLTQPQTTSSLTLYFPNLNNKTNIIIGHSIEVSEGLSHYEDYSKYFRIRICSLLKVCVAIIRNYF